MERLGLGYEDVKQTNPGIIYCSMSGYGQSGPYKKRSGHDLNYVAVAGVLGLTSNPTELPRALPLPLADLTGGLMASHAILASLMGKSKSGKGCYLDVAMMDAALSLMSIRIAIAFGTGKTARHQLLRGGAYDSYRTKDGRFITLGVIEDKFWRNLARALRKEELTQDPRFSTDRSRMENRQLVREILEPILGGRNLEEWIAKFEEEDVPSAPVNRLEELEVDPQIRHRGMLFNLPDDAGRDCRLVGYPALFQGYESLKDQPAPGMGQDTYQILSALGFRESEITFMVQEGVVSVLEKKEQRVLWS
jgi:crotonobetainyl-CoA:carnitine CoA-transferase CaiB-like acyl-CoA transferase